MAKFLTKPKTDIPSKVLLTNRNDSKLVISFKYKLQDGFTFAELEKRQITAFQKFLDIASQLSWSDVDRQYGRKPDRNDKFLNEYIYHYEVAGGFRIHGIFEDSRFKVIRIDPNHRVHD